MHLVACAVVGSPDKALEYRIVHWSSQLYVPFASYDEVFANLPTRIGEQTPKGYYRLVKHNLGIARKSNPLPTSSNCALFELSMTDQFKILVIMACLSLGLWFAVHTFLGSTNDWLDTIDVRSTAYLEKTPEQQAIADARAAEEKLKHQQALAVQAALEKSLSAQNTGDELTVDRVDSDDTERADSDADNEQQEQDEEAEPGDIPAQEPDDETPEIRIVVDTSIDAKEQALLDAIDGELLHANVSTRAVDITLTPNQQCKLPATAIPRVGVRFRQGSSAIKGKSLNNIDKLIELYRLCGGGIVSLEYNPEGLIDAGEALTLRRQEEVKYYLLQRSIPKAAMEFPERS